MLSLMVYLGPAVSSEVADLTEHLQVALPVLGCFFVQSSSSHIIVVLECQTGPSNQTVKVQS